MWVCLVVTLGLLAPPAALGPPAAMAQTPPGQVRLKSLSLSPRGIPFNFDKFLYAVWVHNSQPSVTVTPTVNSVPGHPLATVTVSGAAVRSGSSHTVSVDVGSNVIPVVVTGHDDTSATYTVIVHRCRSSTCSTDATLNGLTVSPYDIEDFTSDGTLFIVAHPNSVETATVRATPTPGATAVIEFNGAVRSASGTTASADVPLVAGDRVPVRITVKAEHPSQTSTRRIYLDRGSVDPGGWNVVKDVEAAFSGGIWSDGETLWGANTGPRRLDAVDLDTGSPVTSRAFSSLPGTSSSGGVVGHGNTLWVVDSVQDKLVAYDHTTRQRKADSDIDLDDVNSSPRGATSDGEFIYVANDGITDATDRVYAYRISDGAFVPENTIRLTNTGRPAGAWTDGTTIWVVNQATNILNAYNLQGDYYHVDKNIEPSHANDEPLSIWGDGDTVWVTDLEDGKLYSYNLRAVSDASDTTGSDTTDSDTRIRTPRIRIHRIRIHRIRIHRIRIHRIRIHRIRIHRIYTGFGYGAGRRRRWRGRRRRRGSGCGGGGTGGWRRGCGGFGGFH